MFHLKSLTITHRPSLERTIQTGDRFEMMTNAEAIRDILPGSSRLGASGEAAFRGGQVT